MWKSTHTFTWKSVEFCSNQCATSTKKFRTFFAKNPSVLCKLYVFVWCFERKFVILFGLVPHQKYYFPNEMNGEKRTWKYHQQICMSASTMWIPNVNKKTHKYYTLSSQFDWMKNLCLCFDCVLCFTWCCWCWCCFCCWYHCR